MLITFSKIRTCEKVASGTAAFDSSASVHKQVTCTDKGGVFNVIYSKKFAQVT